MVARSAYRGVGLQLVDDKGRVAIPSALRASLERNIGGDAAAKEDRFVTIGTHENERCLIGFDQYFDLDQREELNLRARAHATPMGAINSNLIRTGVGVSEAMPFDASGRFVFPGYPRKRAGIAKYAFFYGMLDFFEIWDPKTLLDHPEMADVVKDACRYCLEEKGVVL